MGKVLVIFIGLLVLSCTKNKKHSKPKLSNMVCTEYFVKGQFENGSYTFCGITPTEVEYTYKIGLWKFWNLQGQLVAQGNYKSNNYKIEGQGGCSYDMIEGIMDRDNWMFWDEKGLEIKPDKELVRKIENCVDGYKIND